MASELEVENISLPLNASNQTGRDAATLEGIVLTYSSLFLMALGPILFGSLRSVYYHHDLKVANERLATCILANLTRVYILISGIQMAAQKFESEEVWPLLTRRAREKRPLIG